MSIIVNYRAQHRCKLEVSNS